MPDPPDKGRPSSAPLSVEDADRLADGFTPFWEDAGAADASGPVIAAPTPNPVITAPTPNPGTVTAPMPVAVRKPVGKQTLLGIAPPTVERPSSAPSALPPVEQPVPTPTPVPAEGALTQPLPATAPVAASVLAADALESSTELAVARALPHKKTLVGFAVPSDLAAPAPGARASVAPGAVQHSTPEVPGYAIAYTPKDPPSTPAVVIAPEAQSSPENKPPESRRQLSQTVPSRVRSSPHSSVAPLPPPPAVEDFNPYAAKNSTGKVIGFALVAGLLLLAGVVGVKALNDRDRGPAAQSAPRTDVVQAATAVTPAPTLAPAKSAGNAEPVAAPATAASESAPAAPTSRRTSDAPPAKAKAKAKTKAEAGAAVTRSVTRAPAPAQEPSPTPTKPVSRGVIVRDAPF